MAVTTLSPAQALHQPRRVDFRAIGGLLIMAVTLAGSLSFWGVTNDSRSIVLVAHDLPAGAQLKRDDLAIASVRVDDTIYRAAVPADAVASIVGKRLAGPVYAGQVLAQKEVSGPEALGPGQTAMTIPISVSDAATGILPQSDVQVLLTTDKGKPTSKTTVVLPRVRVADVVYDQTQAVINSGTGPAAAQQRISSLTLIVTPDESLQLAQARWNGDLNVTLLPPEAS